jgi:hypothetical protein
MIKCVLASQNGRRHWVTQLTKLKQILKETRIEWLERRLISKLHMNQGVKVRLDQEGKRRMKTRRGVRKGCCLPHIVFNLYSENFTNEADKGHEKLKTEAQEMLSEICRLPRATGERRNGAEGHD